MIISIDAENAFDKIQHQFMIKTLSKVGKEVIYLNITRPYMTSPPLASYSTGKNCKHSPYDWEQDRDL